MNAPIEIEKIAYRFKFSVCTIVTSKTEYQEMLDSFQRCGFDDDVEYLYIDHTNGNKYSAFEGVNLFLARSLGEYVIVCHQDVLLIDHRQQLEAAIANIESETKHWAILGNAGGVHVKKYAKYFTNGRGEKELIGEVPSEVGSLDENFLVFNRKANVGLSADLTGFHFYGTDACILSNIRGFSCFVIPFMLKHKSFGNQDAVFYKQRKTLMSKYTHKLKDRLIQTPCTKFFVSSSYIKNTVYNTRIAMFFIKEYHKRFRK